ncbi:MAG: translocation/assembly module TamB domain-containing protein [Bacteroidales bacterium]|nr:translocation/assembly module TamB domain-containing protein [Bacteroidales bacterium]
MKRLLKVFLWSITSIIIFIIVVFSLIYIPFIQDIGKEKAIDILGKKTDYKLSIDSFRLKFPLSVDIENLYLNSDKGDTIAYLGSLKTGISLIRLLKSEISIKNINIDRVYLDLSSLIASVKLQGELQSLQLSDLNIKLKAKTGSLSNIYIDGLDLDMKMGYNTLEEDNEKSSSSLEWEFKIGDLKILNSKYSLEDISKLFDLNVVLKDGELKDGNIHLSDNTYTVSSLKIIDSEFSMNLDSLSLGEGFNPMHINMKDINIEADSIYNQIQTVRGYIINGSFKEQSGFVIKQLKGNYRMDSTFMAVDDLIILTPYSNIKGSAFADMSVFSKKKGNLNSNLSADISPIDFYVLTEHFIPKIRNYYPKENLSANIKIAGDVNNLIINDISLLLPDYIDVNANGYLKDIYSPKNASADITFNTEIGNGSFLPKIIEPFIKIDSLSIPKNIAVNGWLKADNGNFNTDIVLKQAASKIDIKGNFSAHNESYDLNLSVDSLSVKRYLPTNPIGIVSFKGDAKGKGLDIFNKNTFSNISMNVDRFDIDNNILRDITLNLELRENGYNVKATGRDSILFFNTSIYGMLKRDLLTVNIDGDAENVDLGALHVINKNVQVSSKFIFRASSDYKYNNSLAAVIDNIIITDNRKINKLGKLEFDGFTNKDTINATLKNGDLKANVISPLNKDSLLVNIKSFSKTLSEQLKNYKFDIDDLFSNAPLFDFYISSGNKNLLYGYSNSHGISYDSLDVNFSNDKNNGLKGYIKSKNIIKDSLLITDAKFNIYQIDSILNFALTANTKGSSKRYSYHVDLNGIFKNDKFFLELYQKNGLDSIGFNLGAIMNINQDGLSLSFDHTKSTILYKNYYINPDNNIYYSFSKKIDANLTIKGADNARLSILTTTPFKNENADAIDLNLENIQLAEISKYLVSVPPFSGLFNARVNLELLKNKMDITGNSVLKDMIFNNERIGNIDLAFNYDTGKNLGAKAYAELQIDSLEVLTAFIDDNKVDSAYFKAGADFKGTPLNIINPFIPDAMASLDGNILGKIDISGEWKNPVIKGEVKTANGNVHVGYANADYKLGDETIRIENNKILFNNYNIYAYNNNPLNINGEINAVNFDNIISNLRISGQNIELLNVNYEGEQMVYGKMFVSLNNTITGPVSLLKIRGNMNVLAGTNFTYTLLDSPVMAQNRVNNLITFTSFTDTTKTNIIAPAKSYSFTGIDMLVNLGIADNVNMAINLSSNGDDRVELIGGGSLSFRINPMGNMDLNGRYNLTGGFVRYNLPVLPMAKTFDIQTGSYVGWTGDIMNPYVNITAFEQIRSSITEEGKGTRTVLFDALIMIKNKLDNLDVSFTVNAPEDPFIQTQIASMTQEERSRQAMNLIITQVYTGPGTTTAKTTANSAINAFIQKEINQFAGSTLKGVDLSFGIDNYDNSTDAGGKRTDYTFRFSKQLFNDRFKIVIGGSVSSGDQSTDNQTQSFIDDVTLEYRLDKSNTRFLQLFHHTGYESVLEGEIVETGIGVVLRRKIRKLKELFIFKERDRKEYIRKQEIKSEQKESIESSK